MRTILKNPRKYRINVLGVVGEVEAGVDLAGCQHRGYFGVGQKFGQEIGAFLPDPHGAALHQAVSVFAGDAVLGERQQHALRMNKAAETC